MNIITDDRKKPPYEAATALLPLIPPANHWRESDENTFHPLNSRSLAVCLTTA